MTHKENIQEILKGCEYCPNWQEGYGVVYPSCSECERGLSEYLKAVKVELYNWKDDKRGYDEIVEDCEEAIKLGEGE